MGGIGDDCITPTPNSHQEDPYITLPEVARDDEDTYDVSPTDNLICCAKLDGEMSSIEVGFG